MRPDPERERLRESQQTDDSQERLALTITMQDDNLKRAAAFIAKCPPAIQGAGGDSRTLQIANVLVWDFALSPTDAMSLFRVWCSGCQPPWTEEQQMAKLRSAVHQPHTKPRGWRLTDKLDFAKPFPTAPNPQPLTTQEKLDRILGFIGSDRPTKADLWDASPVRLCDHVRDDGPIFVESLFQSTDLVNVVETRPSQHDTHVKPSGFGLTLPKSALINRMRGNLFPESYGTMIRPNPMDGHGVRDANVTAYRFMLIEFDEMPLDLQLALLAKVKLPIAAIIYSGGKSMHALLACPNDIKTRDDWNMAIATPKRMFKSIGADVSTLNPSRMTRLPGSMRRSHDGCDMATQELLYLDPSQLTKPTTKSIFT